MLKNEILKLTELRNNPNYFKVPLEKKKRYIFLFRKITNNSKNIHSSKFIKRNAFNKRPFFRQQK